MTKKEESVAEVKPSPYDIRFTVKNLKGRRNPYRVCAIVGKETICTRVDAKDEETAVAIGRDSILNGLMNRLKGKGSLRINRNSGLKEGSEVNG